MANMTKFKLNKIELNLATEHRCLTFISIGACCKNEDSNLCDPTLLHNGIKLHLLFLF